MNYVYFEKNIASCFLWRKIHLSVMISPIFSFSYLLCLPRKVREKNYRNIKRIKKKTILLSNSHLAFYIYLFPKYLDAKLTLKIPDSEIPVQIQFTKITLLTSLFRWQFITSSGPVYIKARSLLQVCPSRYYLDNGTRVTNTMAWEFEKSN